MTNAEKMFKLLGYKFNGSYYINRHKSHISFNEKCIEVSGRGTGKWCDSKHKIITIPQLKAINKKCKELGWLDD